jgi:Tfp pilus assembly protein FimT
MSRGACDHVGPCNRITARQSGFTLIELVITVAIGMVMVALAIPMVQNVFQFYRLRGAVSSATGTLQSTRYQALQRGYPYQLVLNSANSTMQIKNDPTNTGAFANVGNALPLSGTGTPVTLSSDETFTYRPGGMVVSPAADANGNTTFTLTQGTKRATLIVSRFGNINVTYAP